MDIMDLGGGFPGGSLAEYPKFTQSFEQTKPEINDSLKFEVIAEPGRNFCQNSCYLFVRVIGKREKNGQCCYHVNNGKFHSFCCLWSDNVNFNGNEDQFILKLDSDGKKVKS